jgi:hypothetical protein
LVGVGKAKYRTVVDPDIELLARSLCDLALPDGSEVPVIVKGPRRFLCRSLLTVAGSPVLTGEAI